MKQMSNPTHIDREAPNQTGTNGLLTDCERVRRWHLKKSIGQLDCSTEVDFGDMTLPSWSIKNHCRTFSKYSLSLKLRFYYLSLIQLVLELPGWKVGFITVNLSEQLTQTLAQSHGRSIANTYANRVNRRLKKAGVNAHWFGVLEDQKGNLHSHCLVAHHTDDETELKNCFRADGGLTNSSCRLQHTYKQRRRGQRTMRVLRQKFTHSDALGDYIIANIDIGAADYMSKSLYEPSDYMEVGNNRIYCPNALRSSAEKRYETIRAMQKRLMGSKKGLQRLNSHQSLTLLHRGWPPTIEPDSDERYEAQALELDELAAWEEFRNSGNDFDWEYEESDAGVEAYWAAKKLATVKIRERDYEHLINEVEWLIEKQQRREAQAEELIYEQNEIDAGEYFERLQAEYALSIDVQGGRNTARANSHTVKNTDKKSTIFRQYRSNTYSLNHQHPIRNLIVTTPTLRVLDSHGPPEIKIIFKKSGTKKGQ